MRRVARFAAVGLVLGAVGCRDYQAYPKLTSQRGLVPADQFAAYGHEEAEAVAIGREFAALYRGDSPSALARQTVEAVAYARTMPDVVTITPDTLGHRLTIKFKSGWRAAVLPIPDGKRGAETPGLPTRTASTR